MEENGFNNHLSEENNQPANKNGGNILKEPKVVIFKTLDYDLNFNEREAKYKNYDHILCGKCNQEISKWYFYCKSCRDKETDSNEKNRMKNGKPKVEIFNISDYDLNLDERRAKYKDYYCILCEKCSQEISKKHLYCEDCYNEETDVNERFHIKYGRSEKVGIFRTLDYDLNFNEREAKYKDYDYILCEKCIQEINKEHFYCEDCYYKETDSCERLYMKYGSKVGIFKTSDYDLNLDERRTKYKDYCCILCEKCIQEINKEHFYCEDCYYKETDSCERLYMKYGSKVGNFKTSDYDLNLDERRTKYKDYCCILCEKCSQEINREHFYCGDCYHEETDGYEMFHMKYGKYEISDYDLNIKERKAKYLKNYYVLCEKCNQEINEWYSYCEGCYNKETDNYERLCMIYGRSKVGIFKTSDYDLNIKERKAKYLKNYYVLCEKCNQEINREHFYYGDCYHKETDGFERIRMKYGKHERSKVRIFKASDYDLNINERKAKYFKDYDHVFCEKCNEEINFYCLGCYNKD